MRTVLCYKNNPLYDSVKKSEAGCVIFKGKLYVIPNRAYKREWAKEVQA